MHFRLGVQGTESLLSIFRREAGRCGSFPVNRAVSVGKDAYTVCMFTGIIEATAAIVGRTATTLTVERPALCTDIKEGMSICVSGACLSVVAFDADTLRFDVIPETWSRTTLGSRQPGDRVNLERALPAHGRFDGNIVQGHVEGLGTVVSVTAADASQASGDPAHHALTVRLPSDLSRFVVAKGAITIDGVALTVVDASDDTCTVALIPYTREHTTLGTVRKGDAVHIETDILARYIARLMPAFSA